MRNDVIKNLRATTSPKAIKRKSSFKQFGALDKTRKHEGQDGDIRVVKELDGIKLNAKYGNQWYTVPLQTSADIPFQWNYLYHTLDEHSVVAGADNWLDISEYGEQTSTSSATFGDNNYYVVPVDTEIFAMQWMSYESTPGKYMWKIWSCPAEVDYLDVANYNVIFTFDTGSGYTPVQGKNLEIPCRTKIDKGDIIAITGQGPSTTWMRDSSVRFIFKEYF